MRTKPGDGEYPTKLLALEDPPPYLTMSARMPERWAPAVAIVGSRSATKPALDFARDLATDVANAGGVVVSGGAVGIDSMAHEAALAAGGATWVVCGTGCNQVYPVANRDLFARVEAHPNGRMFWPFDDDVDHGPHGKNFLLRNRILVALADVVVVVQARFASGSRNAAAWARELGRPLYAVPIAPWDPDVARFTGCILELELGAKPLLSSAPILKRFGFVPPPATAAPGTGWQVELPGIERIRSSKSTRAGTLPRAKPDPSWGDDEKLVFSNLSPAPVHLDTLVESTGLGIAPLVTALLTLSSKDVVVEGPAGFYRRKIVA